LARRKKGRIAISIQRGESRDVNKYPIMHRMNPCVSKTFVGVIKYLINTIREGKIYLLLASEGSVHG
jgi:hypothetical protein